MEAPTKEYEIEYTNEFNADIKAHKKTGNQSILKKIDTLLNELRKHPRTGTGRPEPLGYDKSGQWSRRITRKHRLIYEIHEHIITVLLLSAFDHYDDK